MVIDPVGPFGQWGVYTDEELKGGGTSSGLGLLGSGRYYDPKTKKMVTRLGVNGNEYDPDLLPYRVFSGMGEGIEDYAVDRVSDQLDVAQSEFIQAHRPKRSQDKLDKASRGLGFVIAGNVDLYIQGRGLVKAASGAIRSRGANEKYGPNGKKGTPYEPRPVEEGQSFEKHHGLPQKFRREFQKVRDEMGVGIDIDHPKYMSWARKGYHQRWSAEYNDQWTAFFRKFQNPNVQQIEEKLEQLRSTGEYR